MVMLLSWSGRDEPPARPAYWEGICAGGSRAWGSPGSDCRGNSRRFRIPARGARALLVRSGDVADADDLAVTRGHVAERGSPVDLHGAGALAAQLVPSDQDLALPDDGARGADVRHEVSEQRGGVHLLEEPHGQDLLGDGGVLQAEGFGRAGGHGVSPCVGAGPLALRCVERSTRDALLVNSLSSFLSERRQAARGLRGEVARPEPVAAERAPIPDVAGDAALGDLLAARPAVEGADDPGLQELHDAGRQVRGLAPVHALAHAAE